MHDRVRTPTQHPPTHPPTRTPETYSHPNPIREPRPTPFALRVWLRQAPCSACSSHTHIPQVCATPSRLLSSSRRISPNLYTKHKGDEAGFVSALVNLLAANGLGPNPTHAEIQAVKKKKVRAKQRAAPCCAPLLLLLWVAPPLRPAFWRSSRRPSGCAARVLCSAAPRSSCCVGLEINADSDKSFLNFLSPAPPRSNWRRTWRGSTRATSSSGSAGGAAGRTRWLRP